MSGAGKFITKHKRSIAITASLAMHALLFCALAISSASTLADKTLKGDGQAEVEHGFAHKRRAATEQGIHHAAQRI